jgi:predicted amidohydrolase YtcJ
MLKKAGLVLLASIVALAVGLAVLTHRAPPPDSQAFVNATVLTMNANDDAVEAVFIEKERITAVGTRVEIEALVTSQTEVHDLGGRTLIPGFIDAHGHFPGSGLVTQGPDLSSPPVGEIESIEQIVETLRSYAHDTPKGDWILGLSYDDTLVAENRHPNRHDLDRASTDHPIVALHVSGHLSVANTKALELAGIDSESVDPQGGIIRREADGHPSGILEETAALPVTAIAMDLGIGDLIEMIGHAVAEYNSVGVTTAQSGMTNQQLIDGLFYAQKLGQIPFRLEVFGDPEVGKRIASGELDPSRYQTDDFNLGATKIIGDGSIQGYTGYLSKPYYVPFQGDADYRGYPTMKREDLAELVSTLHRADLQIAIHGNGDAAIDDIIYAVEQAQQEHEREDPRLIVIHAQMTREDQLDRMRELGITPSYFVAHTYYWGDRHRDIFMGPDRAARMSPAATSIAKGVPFTIHLDTPIVPMQPTLLVWSAVNRLGTSGEVIGPAERISPMAALRAVTIDAAWQIFQEDDRGSIEAGKFADLVVLAENPIDHPARIRDIAVDRTMVGGRTTFVRNP